MSVNSLVRFFAPRKAAPTRPNARRRGTTKPRGYLMLEVIVSGVILATALVGAMVTTQKASNVMAEANRESQASQVMAKTISTFLASPYNTNMTPILPTTGSTLTIGDVFKCDIAWSIASVPLDTVGAVDLNSEVITVTVTYYLPNGGQRSIQSRARRFEIL